MLSCLLSHIHPRSSVKLGFPRQHFSIFNSLLQASSILRSIQHLFTANMRYSSILLVVSLTATYAPAHAYPSLAQLLASRANDVDPTDTSWIKDFSAVGDSYAAGIGAGKVLDGPGDGDCSRYDGAYSAVMNDFLGEELKYQSLACSGDLSTDVRKQVEKLADNSQDLVTVSAGGNDALLSKVLEQCIYTPAGQEKCDQAIDESQDAIDHKLHDNIVTLLQMLAPKVRKGGMAVYTLYGQFFNAETDACSAQTWNWFEGVIEGQHGIKLSKELRKTLNQMVVDANKKIKDAIGEFTESSHGPSMSVAIADWDTAAGDAKGRFCEEGSADDPNDPSNDGLLFQRLNTAQDNIPTKKAKVTARELSKRAPDAIARVFHPTVLGQKLITTYAIMAMVDEKQHQVGSGNPGKSCSTAPLSPPTCKTGGQGIDKKDFEEARDNWCKDTSKPIDSGKEYSKVFSLEYKQSGSETCTPKDCADALNRAWNACEFYRQNPTSDLALLFPFSDLSRSLPDSCNRCRLRLTS